MARDLKSTIERNVKTIQLRPKIAQGTATTTVEVRENLTCDVADGNWRLVGDLDAGSGGDHRGPDPGVFVRAGLGSCLAMGYVMWAARLGIALERVAVTVEADYDARGMYAADSVAPGWSALRYTATIVSDAPAERIRELVATADAHSPVLDDLQRALDVRGELRVETPVRE